MSSIYIDKKLIFNIIKKEFYSSQPKDYDSEESLLGNSEDCSEVVKRAARIDVIDKGLHTTKHTSWWKVAAIIQKQVS